MDEQKRCSERVTPNERFGAFHQYPCTRKAIVERDGKWYCKQHDPEAQRKRNEESYRKYNVKAEQKKLQRKIDTLYAVLEWMIKEKLDTVSVYEIKTTIHNLTVERNLSMTSMGQARKEFK